MMMIMSFYFGQGFLNFPSLTGFVALMLFLASQTPLPPKSGLEEIEAGPAADAQAAQAMSRE